MYGTSPEMMKRMYVTGSLKNQDEGFVFQVKNLIESGSMSGVAKITLDGEEKNIEGATLELGGKVRRVSDISWSAPVYISYGQQLLPSGERVASSITMGVCWGVAGGLVAAAVHWYKTERLSPAKAACCGRGS